MIKDCHNLAANIAASLWQLYCSSAARFTRGLFFAIKGILSKAAAGLMCLAQGHSAITLMRLEPFIKTNAGQLGLGSNQPESSLPSSDLGLVPYLAPRIKPGGNVFYSPYLH